jgi:outer membrane immunogenic protein
VLFLAGHSGFSGDGLELRQLKRFGWWGFRMDSSKLLSKCLGAVAASCLFGGLASAADMAVKAPPPPVPVCTWCGFYVGGNAGWISEDNALGTVSNPGSDAALGVVPGVTEGLSALSSVNFPVGRSNGFIGGVQAGYNWQINQWLLGLETDIQGISGSRVTSALTSTAVVVGTPVTSTQTASMSTSYLGTFRGRVGWVAAPSWLVYATGGVAYGGVKVSDALVQTGTNGFNGFGAGSLSGTRAGWTAGAGVEWMVAPNWSVKGEYLHYDIGTADLAIGPTGTPASAFFTNLAYQGNVTSAHFRGDIVRVGVNYHFGGPVLARY